MTLYGVSQGQLQVMRVQTRRTANGRLETMCPEWSVLQVAHIMQLMQLATLFFGRFTLGGDAHRAGLAQRCRIFALGDAVFGFSVQGLGLRGATHSRRPTTVKWSNVFNIDNQRLTYSGRREGPAGQTIDESRFESHRRYSRRIAGKWRQFSYGRALSFSTAVLPGGHSIGRIPSLDHQK